MLNFQKLELRDISLVKPYFASPHNRACDNTIGAAFMWRDYYDTHYALHAGTLLCKARYEDGRVVFSFPLGKDYEKGLGAIRAYCQQHAVETAFCAITRAELVILEQFFGKIQVVPEPNWNDYLHLTSDFCTFSGRRFNGQRNHMNFFKRNYPDYKFVPVNEENLAAVQAFFQALDVEKPSAMFREEKRKTAEVLDNFQAYGMVGGALMAAGKVIGFSAGELVGDTLYVHIEKADTAYRGAYQMLCSHFAQMFGGGTQFLNREDDAGDMGLRVSKLAYHPYEILEKFTVIC